MSSFQDVRKVLETIAVEKATDAGRLGALLGGTFQPIDKPMPYHQVYQGAMSPDSSFSDCVLRLPKSPEATSAMISCTLSPHTAIGTREVQNAYRGHVDFQPPSARASAQALSYLAVSDGTSKVSFGFHSGEDRVATVVIEIKTQ